MLVICYGMAKSGSTLTFELVKGVLTGAGHSQEKVRSSGLKPRARGNYILSVTRETVTDIIDSIGPDRIVAAKTHGKFSDDMFGWLEDLQRQRKLQVITSYRDPRDICLSLVDHGDKARNNGRRGFAAIHDLGDAANLVERAVVKFRKWSALRGAVRLYFDTVAFSPDEAIATIENVLGVSCDREAAKKYAFEDAFTQRNKARRNRFEDEMDEEDRTEITARFQEFIEEACVRNDQMWFSRCRERILAGGGADSD